MKNNEYENIEIPENIDLFIKKGLNSAVEVKKVKTKKSPFKVAVIAASISALTITTTFGVGAVIKYFKNNSQSKYSYEKQDFEKYSQEVNIATESNGITFIVDNIAVDDNYFNIFYTIKSNKNIRKLGTWEDNPFFIKTPTPQVFEGENQISPIEKDIMIMNDSYADIQKEGKFITDNEFEGIAKLSISKADLKNNDKVSIKLNEIFGIKGNWQVDTVVDKSVADKETYKYDLNKSAKIKLKHLEWSDNTEKTVEHSIDIQRIIISPFANKIIIKETADKKMDNYMPTLNKKFILFDDNNKPLDIITGISNIGEDTYSSTNTYEILGLDKNTKSLKLVPIQYDNNGVYEELEPKSVDKLPIEFEISKYSKLIIEEVKFEKDKIIITYYRDGIADSQPITFHDENGEDLKLGGYHSTSMNRYTGRYTKTVDLRGCTEELAKLSKVKKISTSADIDFELLYDQEIDIELKK